MSQADEIREYALIHHVEPARAAGHRTLCISAGDICRELGLPGRAPNVCSALQSRAFLQLANIKLLERTGPRQSTTTRFQYAISGSPDPLDRSTSSKLAPMSTRKDRQVPHAPSQRFLEGQKLTVVIQCAGSKSPEAGHLHDCGKPILFVARPEEAPRDSNTLYRHPDDTAGDRRTWRDELLEYNRREDNPLKLLPAWQLYRNPVYSKLVKTFGLDNVFILSAGWGMLAADFLTPNYDITFSQAEPYKKRTSRQAYADFRMLPAERTGRIVFIGGMKYVGLFEALTAGSAGERIIFYNSDQAPSVHGCRCIRFETTKRTNWHYGCAKALIAGTLDIPAQ